MLALNLCVFVQNRALVVAVDIMKKGLSEICSVVMCDDSTFHEFSEYVGELTNSMEQSPS